MTDTNPLEWEKRGDSWVAIGTLDRGEYYCISGPSVIDGAHYTVKLDGELHGRKRLSTVQNLCDQHWQKFLAEKAA